MKDEKDILHEVEGVKAQVILCGHTHAPRVVQLYDGRLIINPGSVGLPTYDDDTPNYHAMQTYSALSSYAILEKLDSHWYAELLKVPYDYHLAVEEAHRNGRDDWEQWLATGRAYRTNT